MIKIGSTLTTQKRLSLMEHLLYRLRLRHGGLFLIRTPEKNGRSFLMRYLEKNLSVHEMVFTATSSSKSLLNWLGKSFRISSPTLNDLERELKPLHLNGRHIILLIERTSFFNDNWLADLNAFLEKMPFVKVIITGTHKEMIPISKDKALSTKILSREHWPVLSFAASLEFLEYYYSNLPKRVRFLIAFTSHGRPGIMQKLADHVSIFNRHMIRRTIQVILKNYHLTFPFFPRNFGFLMFLAMMGLIAYFAFHPLMETWRKQRLDRAREVLERSLMEQPKTITDQPEEILDEN